MQAADQFVILDQARQGGLLHEGDVVVLAAAGVGYTWAATVVRWGVPSPSGGG
jgi:3-oxoacyl-[acyl-carrier-protein] synthase-3